MIAVVVLVLLLTLVLRAYAKRARILAALKTIPCKPPLPLIGNALDLWDLTELLPTFQKYFKSYGPVFKLEIGPEIYLHVADTEWSKAILSSNEEIQKADLYRFFYDWLGDGLLLLKGDTWRHHRKLITPTFHFKILEQFIEVFENCSNVLVDKLNGEVGKSQTDIYDFVTLHTLDVICETAMGISINAQRNNTSEYVECTRKIADIIARRSVSPLSQYQFFYQFTSDYRNEKKCLRVLHGTVDKIIAERKQIMIENLRTNNVVQDDEFTGKRKMAFLDMLLKCNLENQELSDKDIRDEVNTFAFEGHDTTASAISFFLYNMGKHPDIQEKVYKEIEMVCGDKDISILTYNELKNLTYLEMVIKESLRLYPSVPTYLRRLQNDFTFDGITVPKGVQILISAYVMHRNPDIFPDPEKFIPERFSPENQSKISLYSYIPFSAGPRNCIGQKFAMLEIKSTVAKVIKHFRIVDVPSFTPILSCEAILKSKNGVHVKIEKR